MEHAQVGESGPPALPADRTLGTLVRAWGEEHAAVPVAVVVSVFDDLLAADAYEQRGAPTGLDDVVIDFEGVARAYGDRNASWAPVLEAALGSFIDDDIVPAAARPLLMRMSEADGMPVDSEQLRQWIRGALGPPATRDEVREHIDTATGDLPLMEIDDTEEQVSLLPFEDLYEMETVIPTPAAVISEREEAQSIDPAPLESEPPVQLPLELPVNVTEEVSPHELVDDEPRYTPTMRPIVRHRVRRLDRAISLSSAPAARTTPGAISDRPGSIIVPAARKWSGFGWIIVLLAACAAVYYYVGFAF